MKIIVIGGTGTIGKAVVQELNQRHQVIAVGQQRGEVHVNLEDEQSIENMYQTIGKVDAVIVTAGKAHFGALTEITAAQYAIGLRNKLMGQVNVVLKGLSYLNDGGSFTLTSGILNRDPIRGASSAAMVNGALDSFVKAAAIELPRGLRINIVSPTVLTESMDKYADYFTGFVPVPAAQVALAYSKSVNGAQTGQVYEVG